jgi:hypothetical protein
VSFPFLRRTLKNCTNGKNHGSNFFKRGHTVLSDFGPTWWGWTELSTLDRMLKWGEMMTPWWPGSEDICTENRFPDWREIMFNVDRSESSST